MLAWLKKESKNNIISEYDLGKLGIGRIGVSKLLASDIIKPSNNGNYLVNVQLIQRIKQLYG